MFGVVSGFAVFLLWNDQISEHPMLFLLGLAVAAATAYVTETLRDLILTGEPETPTPRRILTSFVTLASLETFIIAWHSIVDIFEKTRHLGPNASLADAGSTIVDVVGTIVGVTHPSALLWQFSILLLIWMATGATVGFLFCRLVFLRPTYRRNEGIVRAVVAALISAALVMGYVALIRLVLSVKMLFTEPKVVANGYARLLADMTYQVTRPVIDALLSWWLQIAAILNDASFRSAFAALMHGDVHAVVPVGVGLLGIAIVIVLALIAVRVVLIFLVLGAAFALVIGLGLSAMFWLASLAAYNATLAVILAFLFVAIAVLFVAAVIVVVQRGDLTGSDDAVNLYVLGGIVVALPMIGLLALLIAPLLIDWQDLLKLPIMVFVVWVLPMLVLAVAIPYLRRPSRHTRAWAAIAGIAALAIAAITYVTFEQTISWIGLVATVAVAAGGYALARQEDVTDVWPIAAISLAIISCAGTLLLSDVTASFRGVFTRVAEITMLPQDFPLHGVDIDRGARLVAALQAQEPAPTPAPVVRVHTNFVPFAKMQFKPAPLAPTSANQHLVLSNGELRSLQRYPLGCEPMLHLAGSPAVAQPAWCKKPRPAPTPVPRAVAALLAQHYRAPEPLPTIDPQLERLLTASHPTPTPAPAVAIPQQQAVLERRLACIMHAHQSGTLGALYAPLLAQPWWSAEAVRVRIGGATAALEPGCTTGVAADTLRPLAVVDAAIASEQAAMRATVPLTPADIAYEADLGRMSAAFDQLDRYAQATATPPPATPARPPAVPSTAANTAIDETVPAQRLPPEVIAQILEVCLAGSTAFWLSVAFLATWQMRAVSEREEQPPQDSVALAQATDHG